MRENVKTSQRPNSHLKSSTLNTAPVKIIIGHAANGITASSESSLVGESLNVFKLTVTLHF